MRTLSKVSINRNDFIRLSIASLIIAVLSSNGKLVQANMVPNLLVFQCNGEVRISKDQQYELLSNKIWLGDIQRGYLLNEKYFYIDNNKIKYTNLLTRESYDIADLKKSLRSDILPWQIGHVDDRLIYFSAQKYDKNLPIKKQKFGSVIYRFDRSSKEVQELNIIEGDSPYFSVHKDRIYFTATNGKIHEYNGGQVTSFGIKGGAPSISPDGTKIAFISYGFINSKIFLYDLKNKEHISLISFFGPKSVNPIIQWSENSEFIAVKKKSDISDGSLYLVSVKDKKVIKKFKESLACNWFLVDKANILIESSANH